MILLAAVLTASIHVDLDLSRLLRKAQTSAPQVTCGIKTVGYRFRGTPGQQFRYAGDTYTLPVDGWVELIADRKRDTYAIAGRTLPLESWPQDQFGFRDVPLPSPDTQSEGDSK